MDDFKLVKLHPSNPKEVRDAMYDNDEEIKARTRRQAMVYKICMLKRTWLASQTTWTIHLD